MPLTDTAIRNAKPGRKPFKLSDGGGLFLLIEPRGSKLWRMAYRHAGKQKTLSFGIYPTVTLADARSRRDTARALLADGTDPALQRKLDKQANKIDFRLVAGELLEKMRREERAPATLAKTLWLLEFAYAAIGSRPIAKITALEILDFLRKIEARQKYETARRVRSTCGMVFRYAIATGRAQRDPTLDLRGALTAPKVKHRAAIIDPMQIGALLRDIESFEGQATTRAALRLAPLVFVRPGELRHADWNEFDFERSVWTIPAEKMKMRLPHKVPLARRAIVILNDLKAVSGEFRWLFPSVRAPKQPISENTLNAALRRLGYGPNQMTAHGFRAMAATRLNEMGKWNPDAIERQLAHQERNDVRRAYTHAAEYWSERIVMMQVWADYLDELRDNGKVILFNAAGAN
jgi:integrase